MIAMHSKIRVVVVIAMEGKIDLESKPCNHDSISS